jgi:hypothetical protein
LNQERDEVIEGWRKLHNGEVHNLYSLPSLIRTIKSRMMRWARHVAGMKRRGIHTQFWLEIQKEGDYQTRTRHRWEDNTEMNITEIGCGGRDCTGLA